MPFWIVHILIIYLYFLSTYFIIYNLLIYFPTYISDIGKNFYFYFFNYDQLLLLTQTSLHYYTKYNKYPQEFFFLLHLSRQSLYNLPSPQWVVQSKSLNFICTLSIISAGRKTLNSSNMLRIFSISNDPIKL